MSGQRGLILSPVLYVHLLDWELFNGKMVNDLAAANLQLGLGAK